MISITKIFEFAAAHHLPNHQGLCQNIHGHNYKLEVEVSGELRTSGPATGMVMDFSKLKEVVNVAVLKSLDHSNLNKKFENPTAEEMVGSIALGIQCEINKCFPSNFHESLYNRRPGLMVTRIRLWETSTSYAEWRRES